MIDPLIIVSLISSFSACLVSVLTHIRHSECFSCLKIDTRTPPPITPSIYSV